MSETASASSSANYIQLASDIVSAYVSNNSVPASDLPKLMRDIHGVILSIDSGGAAAAAAEPKAPAVNPKKSVTHDYIICLEDGKQFKSLKRHLRSKYDMTPEQYRAKWGLAADYPMVAPAYAQARSELARNMGLGRKAEPEPEAHNDAAPAGRGRRKKAA